MLSKAYPDAIEHFKQKLASIKTFKELEKLFEDKTKTLSMDIVFTSPWSLHLDSSGTSLTGSCKIMPSIYFGGELYQTQGPESLELKGPFSGSKTLEAAFCLALKESMLTLARVWNT